MATAPQTALHAAFPAGPVVNDDGTLTPAWRGFFLALYNRTGSAPGVDTGGLQQGLTAETAARGAADVGLTNAIATERAARQGADADEATARAAGDAGKLATTGGIVGGDLTVQGRTRLAGLGVLGATAVTVRPTVTGSRGGNVALGSLLTALASFGLITDTTSA